MQNATIELKFTIEGHSGDNIRCERIHQYLSPHGGDGARAINTSELMAKLDHAYETFKYKLSMALNEGDGH